MIFTLRMLSDENEDFVRDYEVLDNTDLQQLHDIICNDLGYDTAGFSSFFTANKNWNKLQEYTLMDMFDDSTDAITLPMEGSLLRDIIASGSSRLIFVFDQISGRSLYLEIAGVKKEEAGMEYPRTAFSAGDPPSQESDEMLDIDDPFADMMEEFEGVEGVEDNGFGDDE